MSGIPSSIAISSLQAAYQARPIMDAQESERAVSTDAAMKQAKATNQAGETVEVEDEDTAIFTDSQGQGSEGRSLDEPPSDEIGEDPKSETGAEDADLAAHLDLTA